MRVRFQFIVVVILGLSLVGCSQFLRVRDNAQALRQANRSLFVNKKPNASNIVGVEQVAREID